MNFNKNKTNINEQLKFSEFIYSELKYPDDGLINIFSEKNFEELFKSYNDCFLDIRRELVSYKKFTKTLKDENNELELENNQLINFMYKLHKKYKEKFDKSLIKNKSDDEIAENFLKYLIKKKSDEEPEEMEYKLKSLQEYISKRDYYEKLEMKKEQLDEELIKVAKLMDEELIKVAKLKKTLVKMINELDSIK